jgi:hypothetical protein
MHMAGQNSAPIDNHDFQSLDRKLFVPVQRGVGRINIVQRRAFAKMRNGLMQHRRQHGFTYAALALLDEMNCSHCLFLG